MITMTPEPPPPLAPEGTALATVILSPLVQATISRNGHVLTTDQEPPPPLAPERTPDQEAGAPRQAAGPPDLEALPTNARAADLPSATIGTSVPTCAPAALEAAEEGPTPSPDREMMAQTLRRQFQRGQAFEIRSLPKRGTGAIPRIFTDADRAAEYGAAIDAQSEAVWVTLNPVRSDPPPTKAILDSDILARQRLMIDLDPERPDGLKGQPATNAEKAAAWTVLKDVLAWLTGQNWPPPQISDSGNGYHLIYAIDLPNVPEATELCRQVLKALQLKFGTPLVKVDSSNSNAGRLTKLIGSWTRKGTPTAERPWRRSALIWCPEELVVVPRVELEAVATLLPELERATSPPHTDEPPGQERPKTPSKTPPRKPRGGRTGTTPEDSPADWFNAHTSWEELLQGTGWTLDHNLEDGELRWTRPGKEGGTSATTGHEERDILHIFTSNGSQFQANENYSKFHVYALLKHNGDMSAAAAAIRTRMRRGLGPLEHATDPAQGDECQLDYANFRARITTEITRHQDGSTTKFFEIEAIRSTTTEGTSTKTVQIPASEYAQMKWPETLLGAEWIVRSGRNTRDRLRELIQEDSAGAIRHVEVHTALGWVSSPHGPIYIHAGGAIGAQGAVPEVRVECSDALAHHVLPSCPPDAERLREAIAARNRVATLTHGQPTPIAAVLMAVTARAVLAPLNTTIHMSGPSGTRKTSVALVAGGSFGRVPPRGMEKGDTSWGSTSNGLQRLVSDRAHGLLIVDELTGEDAIRNANAITQAQGNLKARDRMTRDLRSAPAIDPRGAILSTGESDPDRNSALARMLIIAFFEGCIDLDALTRVQQDVGAGLHRAATAAYVQWLATNDRIGRIRAALPGRVDTRARQLLQDHPGYGGHGRTPRAIAELWVGYEVWLEFATGSGGLDAADAGRLRAFVHAGLLALLETQSQTHEETKPGTRFLTLLRSGLLSQRYHLADTRYIVPPPPPEAFGWVEGEPNAWRVPPGSVRIGYVDGKTGRIYLDPQLAKELARAKGQAGGQPYENVAALARDLDAESLLIAESEGGTRRLTCQKKIRGTKQRFLTLPLSAVLGGNEQEPEDGHGTHCGGESTQP